MNSVCSRRSSCARRNFKTEVSQGDIPKRGTEVATSIVNLIEVHDRGLVSTAHACGVKPAVAFEVFRQELGFRIEEAYNKGFRAGRLSPFSVQVRKAS